MPRPASRRGAIFGLLAILHRVAFSILRLVSIFSTLSVFAQFAMSWRNQGITGSNNIPLGNRRRFGGDSNGDSHGGSPYDPGRGNESGKRGRSPTRGKFIPFRDCEKC